MNASIKRDGSTAGYPVLFQYGQSSSDQINVPSSRVGTNTS